MEKMKKQNNKLILIFLETEMNLLTLVADILSKINFFGVMYL